MTKMFKNKNFIKRDYEVTNVVACVAETAPNENYIEAEFDLTNTQYLYTENNVAYYGYL